MSEDPKQLDKTKIIGFTVTEEELQNVIYPVMHDCYDLGIIDHDTLTSFLRFCVQFWMGYYRMKKQQFDMNQQEIEEEEKKKLAAIVAGKEAWEKWDNSTLRVIEKTVKQLEQMEKDLDRESAAAAFSQTDHHQQQQPRQPKPKPKEQESSSPLANLSLEDMMA
jgi:hypothetical protein